MVFLFDNAKKKMSKKKEAILKAATKLFAEKGFKDTSMAVLSQMTGAAEGTIFYHFKNKEELFVAVLENVRAKIIEEFERFVGERKYENGLDMTEGVISFYLYLAGKREAYLLLLHRHYPYKLAMVNPVCRDHLEAIYNCLVDILERSIVVGQKDGSIDDMDSRKTALILLSTIDGVVRFKNYNLYDAGALYNDLIASCRRILEKRN